MANPPAHGMPPTEDVILGAEPCTPATPVVLVATDGRITSHALSGRRTFIIGRSPEADVLVNEPWISRRHARLDLGPPHRLADLGSANGTRYRGRQLSEREVVELVEGEIVELGRTILLLPRADREPEILPVLGSGAMETARALTARLATTEISILFLGETGVGKQVLAERAHRASRRAAGPFVAVNAANLAGDRLEAELFGEGRPGLLDLASGGTLFLDEVAELSPTAQAKLLHVLERNAASRLGPGPGPTPLDVRFMSATNRNLRSELEAGRFRADLFFRLNGISIYLPPLRERRHEVRGLADELLQVASTSAGRDPPRWSDDALGLLDRHDWPGNVRELRQAVERAVALHEDGIVTAADLCIELSETTRSGQSLRAEVGELEEARIRRALEACGGNQSAAAKILGMSRNTLIARIRAYGLPRPQRRGD
jgi:two-component system, NtrC family, response regulator AtoC